MNLHLVNLQHKLPVFLILSILCVKSDKDRIRSSPKPYNCNNNNGADAPFAVRKSDLVSRAVIAEDDPRISSQANSIKQFSAKMYSELAKEDGNLFFSPYSIISALGMADAGARGETDLEIRKALQTELAGEDFHTGINGLDSVELVSVRIPRFEFTTQSISLVEAFINLGMSVPFSRSADFSGISNTRLYISDILHKAFIKVDEKGTEAAAATGVVFDVTSEPSQPRLQFVANSPFIFLIRDTMTDAILFMGRVLDPSVEP